MDEMEIFSYLGRRFLCSGEQLLSGLFQAEVRYKMSSEEAIRTLALDTGEHLTAAGLSVGIRRREFRNLV